LDLKNGEAALKSNFCLVLKLALSAGIALGATTAAFAQGMVSAPDVQQDLSMQYPNIKQASEQEIVTMQRLLRRLGYLQAEQLSRRVDEATASALDAHFASVKRSPQGMNAEQMIRSLFSEAWIKEGWSTGSVEGQNLVVDKDQVRSAQEVLKKIGYEPGPTDGVFGPATFASIESFQEDSGMKVRGLLTRDMHHNIMRALKFANNKPSSVIQMLNWNGYINPDSLDKFENETNIRVVHNVFDLSTETKDLLLAGSDKYDVIMQTGAQMRLVLEGKDPVVKLDRSKIPNSGNVDPGIRKVAEALDPGNTHTEPYMWGTVGLAVNVDKVRAIRPDLKRFDTTSLILDPAIAADLSKCGIAVVDEPIDVIPSFVQYLGGDIGNISISDLEQVDLALSKVASYVKRVSVESWIGRMAKGEFCVVWGYPGGTYRARDLAKETGTGAITYNVPREGTQMWMDFMVIPTNAHNKDAAYRLIDFMLRPDVAAANTNYLRFANAVTPSAQYIDPVLLKEPGLYPPQATLKKISAMAPISPPVEKLLKSIWQKIPKI
jgi:putrescine transport system substrate-binding protein